MFHASDQGLSINSGGGGGGGGEGAISVNSTPEIR